MNLAFYKYQGTGNDFIMIDNRADVFPKNNLTTIQKLTNRNFGIGADGVILIENDEATDFKMRYFNADGSETMCGNGGRCAVAFAKNLGIIDSKTTFIAFDGLHYAEINQHIVSLQMIDVAEVNVFENHVFANTGTQHHVEIAKDLDTFPVVQKGRKIRNEVYGKAGSNVNFVEQINENTFRVRTYEKGVENETLACGTGVTAVAIAMHTTKKTNSTLISLPVEGGNLQVSFEQDGTGYKNIFLKGPAELVFKGHISL